MSAIKMRRLSGFLTACCAVISVLTLCQLALGANASQQTPTHAAVHKRPKIGLALSGGGARGFAHLGVLKVLEELRIPIDYIAGTSMGSVIGGLYAMGYTAQELSDIILTVNWSEIFSGAPDRKTLFFQQKKQTSRFLLEIGLNGLVPEIPSGLSAGEKISNLFSLLTASAGGVNNFDQLPIPFRAVATDLVTGQEVILDGSQLSLAESMRASMAVPFLFTPIEAGEQLLVDGGLVKNLPIDVVKSMGADIVIAVNVSAPLRNKDELRSLAAIIDQTVSLQIVHSTVQQLVQADVVITPDLSAFSAADFTQARALIQQGVEAVQNQRVQLQAAIAGVEHNHALPLQVVRQRKNTLTIEDVIIEGNANTSDLSLLQEVGITPGETVQMSDLEERIKRIFGVGFFESVRFGVEPGKRGGEVLRIRVKEQELNRLRLGFHFNEKEKGVGLVGLNIQPWRERNALLATELQFGSILNLQVSYLHYRLSETGFFLQPRVFYQDDFQRIFANQRQIGEFKHRAGGVELALGNTFRNFGEVIARYRWEASSFTPDSRRQTLPRFRGNIGRIALTSRLDTFDQWPFPSSGSALRLTYEAADETLGGDTDFMKATMEYQQMFSPSKRHAFSVGARLGSALGTSLPVVEDFLFGGRESFLGFAREELRGAHLGVVSLGYRYRLFDLPVGLGHGVYVNAAFNTGNVWRSLDELNDHFRLRHGGGLGLALDTIVGPVLLDYGVGEAGRNEFYVSIGSPL